MKTKSLILLALPACLVAALFTACSTPAPTFNARQYSTVTNLQTVATTNKVDPAWLTPNFDLFTLGPGDRLQIQLMNDLAARSSAITAALTAEGEATYPTTVVGPDGKIYFHLLPGIDVWGKTVAEARDLIADGLANFMNERPEVLITVRGIESKNVWILGSVRAPGIYPIIGPTTLLEALSAAGGPADIATQKDFAVAENTTELADLKRSLVIRNGKVLPVDFHRLLRQGDMGQNIYLEPGDFIYMPSGKAREVYVLGAVASPRAVPYVEELTLAGAIANCFGTVREAYLNHVAVVRGSLTEPKIAIISYNEIVRGTATDVLLEPGDIVFVPFAPYRYLSRYLDVVMSTFVSSVAINEGSRAVVGEQAQPAGIFIPLGSRITVTPPPAAAPAR